MNEQKHNQTKKKLRVIGVILAIIGVACDVVGFLDFGLCFFGSYPTLFFLVFLGLPMTVGGIALFMFGYQKEISTYVKDESVPVINEAADDLKPAVKSVVSAVKEGLKSEGQNGHTIKCPKCGAENPAEHKFCAECGGSLVKTCPKCGAQQEADDKFCGKCGAKFE